MLIKNVQKHVLFHAGIRRVRKMWKSQRFLTNQSRIKLSKTVQLLIHIQVMNHLHDA